MGFAVTPVVRSPFEALTRNKDVVILDTWQGDGSAVPWYKIRLDNGGEGWIYGKYVELK